MISRKKFLVSGLAAATGLLAALRTVSADADSETLRNLGDAQEKLNAIAHRLDSLNASQVSVGSRVIANAEKLCGDAIAYQSGNALICTEKTMLLGKAHELRLDSLSCADFAAANYMATLTGELSANCPVGLELRYFKIGEMAESAILLREPAEYLHLYTTLDLNHYAVYDALDMARPVSLRFFAEKTTDFSCELTDFAVLAKTLSDTQFLSEEDSVLTSLKKLDAAVQALQQSIVENNSQGLMLGDNTGRRYAVQIRDGALTLVPAVPEKVVFIGNSLLVGWQGQFGMAASAPGRDYAALLEEEIARRLRRTPEVIRISAAAFESAASDADAEPFFAKLREEIPQDAQLVLVQLGDNVPRDSENNYFAQSGAPQLLRLLRALAPNARIAWAGMWYINADAMRAIREACQAFGAACVDFTDLPAMEGSSASVGDAVMLADGSSLTIDNEGVASHPSDTGMQRIAQRIAQTLF